MKSDRQSNQHARSLAAVCLVLLAIGVALNVCPRAGSAQDTPTPTANDAVPGLAELQQGEYERAVQLLTARLASSPTDATAEKYLLRAYMETGRYAEVESSARKFLTQTPNACGVRHMLAESLTATGRYSEAVGEFERAAKDLTTAKAAPAEYYESDLRRAEVLKLTGQDERAREIFQTIAGYYNDTEPQTAPDLTLAARALVQLEKYKDASELYTAAIDADPEFIEAHLGGGELFTEKYNYAEAAQFFADALEINPNSARAHLGLAANKRLEGDGEVVAALARALTINPNLVEARALKAGLDLEAGEYDTAALELDKVLKTNPRALEAHALRAALAYLQDRDYEPAVQQALAINPRYGALYDTLAHYATITRRTAQAAEFARRGVALAPRLWRAHLSLGMALLRLGRMDEGRAAVETSFAGDPFNVWAKNTLDLLDEMRDYRETKRGAFLIKADAKESDVLAPYAAELLEEAAAKLTAKYRFTPQGPVVVELFPNHEDFAVRALGLPGLGALGVCFGPVIAQDSPSARPAGQFNWGSTLWHEYTHVITLQMTDYRIPRWFSEGLSVYEERRARPGWGDEWNPFVLRAFAAGRWFKINDLDAGFMRPRTPTDVSLAYFQASQVCEFITERYGFDAILRMLALYRDKARTPDVLRQALKLSESEFDRAFMEYVASKARPLQQALGDEGALAMQLSKEAVVKLLGTQETFALHLRAGALAQAEGDTASATRHFKRAVELFPYYTGEGNAYDALADIYDKQGDTAAAADALALLVKQDENNLPAVERLARLRLKQNDPPCPRSLAFEFLRQPF